MGSYALKCKVHLWALWVRLALRESSADCPLQNRSYFYRGRTAFRQLLWPTKQHLPVMSHVPLSKGQPQATLQSGKVVVFPLSTFCRFLWWTNSLLSDPCPWAPASLCVLPNPVIKICTQHFYMRMFIVALDIVERVRIMPSSGITSYQYLVFYMTVCMYALRVM